MKADKVLLPELYHKRKRPRKKPGKKGFLKQFLLAFLMMLVVSGLLFSYADIGGNMALNIAKTSLSKNFGIGLNADEITGNPIKGYVIRNFGLTDQVSSRDIFSAGFLSVRVNLPALLTGNLRIAEISLGGISMDVEKFIASLREMKLPLPQENHEASRIIFASPAFADDGESLPKLPLDRVRIIDSRFSSVLGVFDAHEITADVPHLNVDVDGGINGLPLRGKIDMAGITEINRSELFLGTGKIIATGGLDGVNIAISMSGENFGMNELAMLCPAFMSPGDFDGKADFSAEITGTYDSPEVRASAEYFGAKFYGLPIERASANITYRNKRITVSNIQASALGIPIQGEIAAAFRPGEPVSLMIKLDGNETTLTGLDNILGIPELKEIAGKVSLLNVNISGTSDELSGLASFNAPRISYGGNVMSDIRVQMKFSGSNTANVDGKFTFEDAPGYISGNIASALTAPLLDITAKIAGLDIKQIESVIPDAPQYKLSGKITASLSMKGKASSPSIAGMIESNEFSGFGYTVMKPAVRFGFDGKTLALRQTAGTLNGLPVNINGTISPLPSSAPSLDINATITIAPETLKASIPGGENLSLDGIVNAGIKITGDTENPSVFMLAASPSLQLNGITAKGLEVTTAVDMDTAKSDSMSAGISASSLTAGAITLTGANARVSRNSDSITLDGFSAKSGGGIITGVGNASVSGKSPLDLSFMFTDLELESLTNISDCVKGKLSGTLKVSGNHKNPSLRLNAVVPELDAWGFPVKNFSAVLSGDMAGLALNNARAEIDGSEINAEGTIQLIPGVRAEVSLSGERVDVARLMRNFPAMNGALSGTAGFTVKINADGDNVMAFGTVTAETLSAFGLKLSDVRLPLSYYGGGFMSSGGTANFYGGTIVNTLNLATEDMSFTDEIEAGSFDVNALIHDMAGGIEGNISGNGRLDFRVSGIAGNSPEYDGSGTFSAGPGEITGFKWLDMLAKLHGQDGLKYESIDADILLQEGKLTVLEDSGITAKDDAVFSYVRLPNDGALYFSDGKFTFDLLTESGINSRLISTLQGSMKGGIESLMRGGMSGFRDNIAALLEGIVKGDAKSSQPEDFSTVTLRLHGTPGSLSFSELNIAPPEPKTDDKPATPRPRKRTVRPKPKPAPKPARKEPGIDMSNPQRILRIWGSEN